MSSHVGEDNDGKPTTVGKDSLTSVVNFATSAPSPLGAKIIWMGIRFYQLAISPVLGPACRYYPTCSNYALEAIKRYGALKGGWLAIKRISKCHPFRPGGFDPVP